MKLLTKRGKEVSGRKAAKTRAKYWRGRRGSVVTHNVPLEITLYLVRPSRITICGTKVDDLIEFLYCGFTAEEGP